MDSKIFALLIHSPLATVARAAGPGWATSQALHLRHAPGWQGRRKLGRLLPIDRLLSWKSTWGLNQGPYGMLAIEIFAGYATMLAPECNSIKHFDSDCNPEVRYVIFHLWEPVSAEKFPISNFWSRATQLVLSSEDTGICFINKL